MNDQPTITLPTGTLVEFSTVLFDLDIDFHVEGFLGRPENHRIPGTKNILEITALELSFDAEGRYLGMMGFAFGEAVRMLRNGETEVIVHDDEDGPKA